MTIRGRIYGALFLLMALASVSLFADTTVRCESKGGRRVCSVDNIGRVALRRQLSILPCTEEETWGYTNDAIWVDQGCRADFTVSTRRRYRDEERADRYGDRDRGGRLICESEGGRHYCAADTRFGVELARTLGRRSCVEGETWGATDRAVWVDGGCRGEFLIGGRRPEPREERPAETIVCESDYNRRRDCRAETRFGVELKRQLSRTECVFNRTWGFDRNVVWVANGCRAEFLIRVR